MKSSIQRVSKFQTDDGTLFDDETSAKQHQVRLDALAELTLVLKSSVGTGRVESVIRHLLEEEEAVRKILLRYSRRFPKTVAKGIGDNDLVVLLL